MRLCIGHALVLEQKSWVDTQMYFPVKEGEPLKPVHEGIVDNGSQHQPISNTGGPSKVEHVDSLQRGMGIA